MLVDMNSKTLHAVVVFYRMNVKVAPEKTFSFFPLCSKLYYNEYSLLVFLFTFFPTTSVQPLPGKLLP